ncbi:DUF5518 domain-containing protein [Halorussus amylolyticus]|uniref:DUF5518 domain-containing protein n=1 Tax=Halorussus amylolyticus TaxID=1126242 RepID=UPI00104DF5DA|nr:DUF5518 domain-containing protein [Halorussus amylolyticus]
MSPSLLRIGPSAWRFALVGALASLPVTALVNRLPNSEADIAGGIMIVGAFIAGAIAVLRSTDPEAAGLRAGLLSGVVAILTPLVAPDGLSVAGLIAWPSPHVLVALAVVALVLASMFGLVCGRIGGWVATTVTTRWTATPS